MEIKILNKKTNKYVKSEDYGDRYLIDQKGNVVKQEYSDRYGHRNIFIDQNDYKVEVFKND